MTIHEILWRNEGQVLTPELIVGILHGVMQKDDNALILSLGEFTDEYKGVMFHVERLADCLDEVKTLHQTQWEEVERVRDHLDPDYDAIINAETSGRYVLFTAKRDGVMIGNCGIYLYQSAHNKMLCAKEDTMFLVSKERKGLMASKFFDYCESMLTEKAGVKEVTMKVKTTNKAHVLWIRKGYIWTDRVLTKTFYDDDGE